MKRTKGQKLSVCAILLVSGLTNTAVLADSDSNLRDEILAMDAEMFTAFNQRDVQTMRELFAADLEFYHDKTGLTGREYSINSLKSLAESGIDLTRELLSTEVYPIPDFGAIQTRGTPILSYRGRRAGLRSVQVHAYMAAGLAGLEDHPRHQL